MWAGGCTRASLSLVALVVSGRLKAMVIPKQVKNKLRPRYLLRLVHEAEELEKELSQDLVPGFQHRIRVRSGPLTNETAATTSAT